MSLLEKDFFFLWIAIIYFLPNSIVGQSIPAYQESSGLVVIEIESAASYSNWRVDTAITGYTGESYLNYRGINYFNTPEKSLLNFKVAIEKLGKYRFQWRSIIAEGTSNTEHNDSWLRFKDASDFYGKKGAERVYPKGSGKLPNPEGSGKDNWFKIYQNYRNGWTWQTRTSDNDPHEIFVEFDTAGIYNIEISGRSKGHAIDRFVLFHSEVSSATALDLSHPESERIQTVAVQEIPFRTLKIRPTLVSDAIYLELPSSINTAKIEGKIINATGQRIDTFSFLTTAKNEVAIPVDQIGRGIYFVRFWMEGFYYQGKFVKL